MANSTTTYLMLLWRTRMKWFLNLLPFFKHKNYIPFLIVGHPRTGTSLLHTYLNSHPSVLSLNEALSHTTDGRLLFKLYSKTIKVVGFKYFYEYIVELEKRNTLIELVSQHPIKVIRIHRRNYLRTFLSLKIAEKTKEWSSTNTGKGSVVNKRVELSKQECIDAFGTYKKWETEVELVLKQYQVPVFEVEYEELVSNSEKIMKEVQEFLCVTPQSLQSLLVRQNPEKLSELIVNYEELKTVFAGTEWVSFFEE